jgi:hypothetical protein
LTKQRLILIEGMNRKRTGAGGPGFAGGKRVGVAVAADHELGTAVADARNLRR